MAGVTVDYVKVSHDESNGLGDTAKPRSRTRSPGNSRRLNLSHKRVSAWHCPQPESVYAWIPKNKRESLKPTSHHSMGYARR